VNRIKMILLLSTGFLLLLFQNCSNNYKLTTNGSNPTGGENAAGIGGGNPNPIPSPSVIPTPTPSPSSNPVVCNPFGGSSGSSGMGLITNGVYYVDVASLPSGTSPDADINNSVLNLLNAKTPYVDYANVDVYLSQINYPSMYFTDGFTDSSGDTLKDSTGATLIQYFGFQAKSVFVPGDWAPGDYEIAVLSDDGSILTMTGGQADGSDLVINNDGAHALTMGCTTEVLHVTANSQIPMTFDYFQGPPVTIGMIMMYRPVSVSGTAQDPLCGKGGDPYYFQDHDANGPINPATPLAPYQQLVGAFGAQAAGSGGWKVVEPNHFQLPAGTQPACN